MSIEQFIVRLLQWLGFDKEPDEGRRRFMLGLVFTAATVQYGLSRPKAKPQGGLDAWLPDPSDSPFFGIDRTVVTPQTATLSSISDILKQMYPQQTMERMLYTSSPMLALLQKAAP